MTAAETVMKNDELFVQLKFDALCSMSFGIVRSHSVQDVIQPEKVTELLQQKQNHVPDYVVLRFREGEKTRVRQCDLNMQTWSGVRYSL